MILDLDSPPEKAFDMDIRLKGISVLFPHYDTVER